MWSGPNSFNSATQSLNNLFAGLYNLVVSDANGCNIVYQIIVDEPVGLSQSIEIEKSNYSTFEISCFQGDDGWITATALGGYFPYSFQWFEAGTLISTSNIVNNLEAGTYSLIVEDGLGCDEEFVFVLNEPTELLNLTISSLYDYNGYDVSCYGGNDGGIMVGVTGGVPPYSYFWDNSQSFNPHIYQESGLHLLDLIDNNGCELEGSIVLNQPDELVWSTVVFPDTCKRQVGEITVNVNGGVYPYVYLWSDSQISSTAENLFEGQYTVEIQDANGCQIFDTLLVSNLVGPKMDFAIMSDYERLYDQLKNPIVFIDMTELAWQNALYWEWDFGDGTSGNDSIAFHSYQAIGEYDVLLKITTDYNCIDTLVKKVIIQEYELFIPNAFTPNSSDDYINDEFRPYGIGIKEFRMNIYSRWGELIYTTDNIDVGWNGKFQNEGPEAQLGVYAYYIEVEDIFGAIHQYAGQINLIR